MSRFEANGAGGSTLQRKHQGDTRWVETEGQIILFRLPESASTTIAMHGGDTRIETRHRGTETTDTTTNRVTSTERSHGVESTAVPTLRPPSFHKHLTARIGWRKNVLGMLKWALEGIPLPMPGAGIPSDPPGLQTMGATRSTAENGNARTMESQDPQ